MGPADVAWAMTVSGVARETLGTAARSCEALVTGRARAGMLWSIRARHPASRLGVDRSRSTAQIHHPHGTQGRADLGAQEVDPVLGARAVVGETVPRYFMASGRLIPAHQSADSASREVVDRDLHVLAVRHGVRHARGAVERVGCGAREPER